jgi:hypothetical protein
MRWLLPLLIALVAVPAIARAGTGSSRSTSVRANSSLDDARKAIEEIRYDDARGLLVQALKQGGSRPDQLVEIYRLSAATAAVLGANDLAEQYYRRMLALDPDASLPQDASPRLREPFVAAQAFMAAQQRFEARATRSAKGIEVSIIDPLGMVVAVGTLEAGELRNKQPFAAQSITLPDVGDEVVALDEHGNFLRVIELPSRADPLISDAQPRMPFVRRWTTWAIPAVVFAGATTYFFIDASRAHDRHDELLADSSGHFFDEVDAERRHWRRSTIIGWVGVGLTVATATTAFMMAATRDRATVSVTPSVGSDHASVQLEAKF